LWGLRLPRLVARHAVAILRGLAEDEMCLPYTIERLKNAVQKLDLSNTKTGRTQQALVQAENWPAWVSWRPASPTR